jgi:hypothetical protein
MDCNGHTDENKPPILIAGLVCLFSLPIIYWATRPLIWVLHGAWMPWLFTPLFTLLPMSMAFTVLYRSVWHQEWHGSKRILPLILMSGVIFCAVLFIIAVTLGIGCLCTGIGRVGPG